MLHKIKSKLLNIRHSLKYRNYVQRVYVERDNEIAFVYYSGKNGSFSKCLRFIGEYAPDYRDRFTIGGSETLELNYNGSPIEKDIYLVARDGVVEIISKRCIEFLYRGKIDVKI